MKALAGAASQTSHTVAALARDRVGIGMAGVLAIVSKHYGMLLDRPALRGTRGSREGEGPSPLRLKLRQRLGYGAVAGGATALSLLLLQLILGRRLEQAQISQLGSEVTSNLLLGEVALERFTPRTLARISGMRLAVGSRPESSPPGRPPGGGQERLDPGLMSQTERLRRELCRRLNRCPVLLPTTRGPRGVWVEMDSALEPTWLFAPLPPVRGWPPDPSLLSVALGAGGLTTFLLYLTLEVQRPLRQLEEALGGVGLETRPAPLPVRGSGAVQRLTAHFNAMVARLDDATQERSTMLAGIAHDLRSPLTRLRLRLGIAGGGIPGPLERSRTEADLASIERITRQFLLFAGAEGSEPVVAVPLQDLLAETAAVVGEMSLRLQLMPMERRVRPTALARAVANLLENAMSHGRPPLELLLGPWPQGGDGGFEIQVRDQGDGIAPEDWQRALQPFQRLDPARGGEGHCGLGLAIANQVARAHGGELACVSSMGARGFAVALRGHSLEGE